MSKYDAPVPAYGGLCFTAMSANSSVQLTKSGTAPAVNLVKSTDGVNWSEYAVGDVISLPNIGDKVYLAAGEGGNTQFASSSRAYNKFVMSGEIAASGDITSLLDFDLTDKALSSYCYYRMFSGCTSLVSAPELPATTLATHCYDSMFRECTSLVSAPELPATTLATYCYSSMFYRCTSLTSIKIKVKSWTTYTNSSYQWVIGVSSSGSFYKPAELPEEYGPDRIPTGWSVVNI